MEAWPACWRRGRTAGIMELHRHLLPTRRSRERRRPFPSALHPLTPRSGGRATVTLLHPSRETRSEVVE
ncbi:hypothetical protein C2845_PM02G15130 [Panicum miliaceum]|uniref:Uncharacterized protein n=1 Tax=Panicum miliaceum TaxID=4540 RepID=A0A3L6S4U9_PANMI|nr:hypothetical protein C2845_PM02G15130 [Panicum miliaceum]